NVVVDAILGSGLNKSLTGFMATIVQMINASEALIISIDISSGLFAEKPMPDNSIAVRPDYTLTFQLPKLAFMFSENARFTGEWQLLDIGLHGEFMQNENTPYCFVDKEFIRTFYKSKREKFSHKNSYGKVLITAGSYGMMGAALLTAEACLRTGCGVLKAYIPKCGYDIFQTALPEAMTLTDDHFEYHTKLPDVTGFDVIGVGPGLAEGKDVKEVLKKLFKSVKCPLVLDAGALNLLAKHKDLLKMLPKGSVLTPHPGEFGRLAGAPVNDYDRLERLMKFSAETGCMVLLKGAHSAIASPDGKVYFNSTGTPGMATPGTGDALTGVITSLLAQGYPPLQSTILGAYIHGYAGERASEEFGDASMLASDLIGKIKDFYLDF
ncbi:MAG: NAD(P)H-hydrate dehydratase, partial [Cytophagaceae bacterium]